MNTSCVSVEITASMSCFGIGLAFFEVVLTSFFGVTTTFVFIWISLPLSSGLFSLAAVHNQFVHAQPVLVYVIQLFMCKFHPHLGLFLVNVIIVSFFGENMKENLTSFSWSDLLIYRDTSDFSLRPRHILTSQQVDKKIAAINRLSAEQLQNNLI